MASEDSRALPKIKPPIDSSTLTQEQVKQALDGLPVSFRKEIVEVIKEPSPKREDQSPEAVRKAALLDLKRRRRDIVSALVEIEKEIFQAEDLERQSLSSEDRRGLILAALRGTKDHLGRRNFSLAEMRELYPNDGISFATWKTELTALAHEHVIFYSESSGMVVILEGA